MYNPSRIENTSAVLSRESCIGNYGRNKRFIPGVQWSLWIYA